MILADFIAKIMVLFFYYTRDITVLVKKTCTLVSP